MTSASDSNLKTANLLQQAERFARDLAEWVLHGHLTLPIMTMVGNEEKILFNYASASTFIRENPDVTGIWFAYTDGGVEEYHPAWNVLVSLGYLTSEDRYSGEFITGRSFFFTEKTWSLLSKPHETPTLFISYKRGISSAMALLIEARLRLVGADPDHIFIDKDIKLGDEWAQLIESQVRQCNHFISLIGPGSLDSPYVRMEIDWALADPNRRIIPILHSGYTIKDMQEKFPELGAKLAEKQVHVVDGDTAAKYEEAVNYVLRSLGYRTY